MSLFPSQLFAHLQTRIFWNSGKTDSTDDPPPVPRALLWLALLGTVAAASGMYAALLGKTTYGQPWTVDLPMPRAIGAGIWMTITVVFWATLLTWFLVRIAHDNIRLDHLYTILAVATAPWMLPALLFPLRELSLSYLLVWRILHWIATVGSCGLIVLGVRARMSTTFNKAAQCALPALLMNLTLAIRADRTTPTTFHTVCNWQKTEGRHVRIYAPMGKTGQEIQEILTGADRLVEEETRILVLSSGEGTDRSREKIELFLFADDTLQRQVAGREEEPNNTAHSFWDCVTMTYAPWKDKMLRRQLAHEICHVLLAKRIGDQVHGLLDEGLCEYVAYRAVPESTDLKPTIATRLSLRILSRPAAFFDWTEAEQEAAGIRSYYLTAHSFVTYLIERDHIERQGHSTHMNQASGIEGFKRLYKTYADKIHPNDPDPDEATALSESLTETYGTSAERLEAEWRKMR